ncbi:hypothetical protein ACOME3_003260 [Neoechinorhynchus agilis]
MKTFLVFLALFSVVVAVVQKRGAYEAASPSELATYVRGVAWAMTSRTCGVDIANLPPTLKNGQTLLIQFKVTSPVIEDMVYEMEVDVEPARFVLLSLTYLNPQLYKVVDASCPKGSQ